MWALTVKGILPPRSLFYAPRHGKIAIYGFVCRRWQTAQAGGTEYEVRVWETRFGVFGVSFFGLDAYVGWGDGEWRMESGKWRMENGERRDERPVPSFSTLHYPFSIAPGE
jgi:hypothetical protein